jgi:hypothetical protein
MFGLRKCFVCDETITIPGANNELVCFRSTCQFVAQQKTKMPPMLYEPFLKAQSLQIKESIRKANEEKLSVVKARKKEAAQNRSYYKKEILQKLNLDKKEYPLIAIPSNRRKLVKVSNARRKIFRDNLKKTLASALAADKQEEVTETLAGSVQEGAQIVNSSCGICAGACCLQGGDRAYLNEENLIRIMRKFPSQRPNQILKKYLSAISEKVYENSCIYHTQTGCSLPRELRSEVCNQFFCPSLKDYLKYAKKNPENKKAAIIVRNRELWPFPNDNDKGIESAWLAEDESVTRV